MAASAKQRYYARYIAHYTKKNNTIIALGGLFIAGMVLGVMLLRGAGHDTLLLLERLVGGFIAGRAQAGLYENFISAFSSSMLFVVAVFVAGFCAIAQPVILAVPLVRGLGFGFSAASLYLRYGAQATGMVGVLMLPGMLLSTLAILICCRQALRFSGAFFAAMRNESDKTAHPLSLRAHCAVHAFALGLCALGAFIEAVLYLAFANSFVLS